ncbi:hypothetical protein Fot_11249 [Forsythia ovata]|uniref:Uncharacterized protein n=1 Tax=Forsythia ovata TaxID=205694 RepID=A0ABD1WJ59_9LAMI
MPSLERLERKDVETAIDKLLADKKCLEEKLVNTDAEFTTNFHKTEVYSSFFNYFVSIGQLKVLALPQWDNPKLDVASFEARFPLIELEEEDVERRVSVLMSSSPIGNFDFD